MADMGPAISYTISSGWLSSLLRIFFGVRPVERTVERNDKRPPDTTKEEQLLEKKENKTWAILVLKTQSGTSGIGCSGFLIRHGLHPSARGQRDGGQRRQEARKGPRRAASGIRGRLGLGLVLLLAAIIERRQEVVAVAGEQARSHGG